MDVALKRRIIRSGRAWPRFTRSRLESPTLANAGQCWPILARLKHATTPQRLAKNDMQHLVNGGPMHAIGLSCLIYRSFRRTSREPVQYQQCQTRCTRGSSGASLTLQLKACVRSCLQGAVHWECVSVAANESCSPHSGFGITRASHCQYFRVQTESYTIEAMSARACLSL